VRCRWDRDEYTGGVFGRVVEGDPGWWEIDRTADVRNASEVMSVR
jgi:hypothetical protein